MRDLTNPFAVLQVIEREGPEALRRVPFRFAQTVPKGSTVTLTREIPSDCTVERLEIRFYPGQELALHVYPYIVDERGNTRPLVDLTGKAYIDGDDDLVTFTLREPMRKEPNERLAFRVVNTTDALSGYDYNFYAVVEVDLAGGAWPSWAIAGLGVS